MRNSFRRIRIHFDVLILPHYNLISTAMYLRSTPICIFLLTLFYSFAGPENPTPAPAQSGAILIMGATAHLGNGSVISNSAIGFEGGKLTLVADATTIRIDRSKYATVYDASGKHVYPGFIAPVTNLGLAEIEAARATIDYADIGQYNPNLRSLVAYNTDSEVIPTVRSNGVLLAQVTPSGGTISGSSSVVQSNAWNWKTRTIVQTRAFILTGLK